MTSIAINDPDALTVVEIDWTTTGPAVPVDLWDPAELPVVTVDWDTGDTSVFPPMAVVEIPLAIGLPGSPGPTGATGPVGPPGSSVINPFVFNQAMPEMFWLIVHNLNTFPTVTVVDSSNQQVFGEVDYPDANTVRLSFGAAFSGTAYLV